MILQRSGSKILTDGGLTAEPSDTTPSNAPEAKARAVYSAFARFREKHCLPLIPRYPRPSLDEHSRASISTEARLLHIAVLQPLHALVLP